MPVAIPEKVEAKITGNTVEIKGEKGTLSFEFSPHVSVESKD